MKGVPIVAEWACMSRYVASGMQDARERERMTVGDLAEKPIIDKQLECKINSGARCKVKEGVLLRGDFAGPNDVMLMCTFEGG